MANTENMSDEALASILGSSNSNSRGTIRSNRMSRIDTPLLGIRPAATVIRRSNRPTVHFTNETQQHPQQPERNVELELAIKEKTPTPTPMIGDVMERIPIRTQTSTRPKSKFATERQGFPTLMRPLGAFIKKTNSATLMSSKPFFTPNVIEATTPTDPDVLHSHIARDADALLEQMSATEIKDGVQELEAALTPEMLNFLKNRRKKKVSRSFPEEKGLTGKPTKTHPNKSILSTTTPTPTTTTPNRQEKERIAHVLTSIQTIEDLDKAYEREMGTGIQFNTQNCQQDWTKACNLLRSTSTRQSLWAAKTLCEKLETDIQNNHTCRIGECTTELPYPAILPVSLRCLLDDSTSIGGLLHTYVLRSIYALLQLRAPIDHVVDVTLTKPTSMQLYQEHFLEDTIPTASFGASYPKIAITPIYSNVISDAVAYSTSSSSTSATQDATSFWGDPMWTLLSKMKIIPRLAQITLNTQLPREAMVAICGIMAMLSIRSPGAAVAIAQHKTLLTCVLQRSLLPPDEASTTKDYLNPAIAIPAMILLCTMARQSRSVATVIPFDSIVPPLLAMDTCEPKLVRWALVLWRTMVRYGLGLQHVQFIVARSVVHLAKARVVDTPLAVEFLTCFANVLDCVKVAKHKNTTSIHVTQEEMGIMMDAEGWLASTIKTASEILGTKIERSTRLKAACLRLLQSYASIYAPIDNQKPIHLSEFFLAESYPLLANLKGLIVDGTLAMAIEQGICNKSSNVINEAVCCALVDAFAALSTSFVSIWDSLECASQVMLTDISNSYENLFTVMNIRLHASDRARQGWLNQTQFRIVRLLLDTADDDLAFRSVRSLAFDLLGRLEKGEEAQAAILFSNDKLFIPLNPNVGTSSGLSSMFISELCSSNVAQMQADHSFKLLRGFGITTDGWGPFTLDTLLSDAERSNSSNDAEKLLPLGKLWLWQVLSGEIRNSFLESFSEQHSLVLVSCLELILDIELTSDALAKSTPLGSKLYFLLNLCLAPESILRSNDVHTLSLRLVDHYVQQLNNEGNFGSDMIMTCYKHSRVQSQATDDTEAATGKVTKLFNTLTGDCAVQSNALRTMVDFIADICSAFIEYGAQYEIFVKCIRIMLRPEFPSKIQIETLTRLRDVVSLLTLPNEVELWPTLAEMSSGCILDTIPGDNGAMMESPEILDLVANILKTDAYKRIDPCTQGDFFLLVACAMLGRSLTGALKFSRSLEPLTWRMVGLPSHLVTIVCRFPCIFLTLNISVTRRSMVEHVILQCKTVPVNKEVLSREAVATELEKILTTWNNKYCS